ncbi:3-ketoacyl-CoA synthase 6-like [Impatiens glandulifera]|uniref:3-ketoacyl-CoA synthase 6-like n=1 Tax=Impatiens glandulifera TaxID=253017 RepID=UPI001FB0BADD|nr:3-ketoacyl-CoA synthase 6-like [Impatiens glandulifera]
MKQLSLLILLSLELKSLLINILTDWKPILFIMFLVVVLFLYLQMFYSLMSPAPVYLVDFSCLKPPNSCRVPFSKFVEHTRMFDFLDQNDADFMSNVLYSSGQGEETSLPPAIHYIPPLSNHKDAVDEVHMVLFPVFQDLLSKTKLLPKDIHILIVNCSGFCPSPSLSSIIINRFKMTESIKAFTISGMGCSGSALAVDMASNLLKVHKNSNAVVLSTEILSTGWYAGKERPMMVLNCVFRMGAAAIFLSNKKQFNQTSKYKLRLSLRSQRAFDDKAYYSAYRQEDSNGFTGVALRRELLLVAGETLRSNITLLGSSILPFTEIFRYGLSVFWKRIVDKSVDIYVPDFRSAIQHFCLPVSGRPVIKEVAKGLNLGEKETEAAMSTLHRFGNQSSSSLWYELAYLEGKDKVLKGHKVWQLGMGSGPKCTSLVWECLRPITDEAQKGPWAECIDRYPAQAHLYS